VKPKEDSKILDVGSGAGNILLNLRDCGFSNLTGIDPYIKKDIYYKNGVQIFKKTIYELTSQYDIIIFNHSFEHMPHPLEIFRHLSSIVAENGLIIIRIPTVSSFAWKCYKTDWVQLDAPRHLFLHSINSIEILAKTAGLTVELIEYDSNSFQYFGSEQYKMDIPLYHEKSFFMSRKNSLFTRSNIVEYEKKSLELNANNNGDQFTAYLRKS
jgi:2-polyprenyl-3-methyl-5-hydroxy-6-metoxy-1,4-benzoquinol methylase